MDACIARGGISHVLSQARASLKNPSRPFTPRTNDRPLFHGDDYRPGSRPSSSYSVAEEKELAMKSAVTRRPNVGAGPSGGALPPRPTAKSATTRAPMPTPRTRATPDSNTKSDEPSRPQDQDSASEIDPSGDEKSEVMVASQHVLEQSVNFPSPDALEMTLRDITTQLDELSRQSPDRITRQNIDALTRTLVDFTTRSAVFITSRNPSKRSTADTPSSTTQICGLRRRLFDSLIDLAVDAWHTSAKCVIAITPCILELFRVGFGCQAHDEVAAKVVSLGKILFILSKEIQNDLEFCSVRYVESILSLIAETNQHTAFHRSSTESTVSCPLRTLIYVAGTLKNVSSGDDKMLKLLATNGAIAILSESLLWRSQDPSESKEIAQILVQTTTVLRNLSTTKAYLKQFNEARVASRLCEMIDSYLQHQELMVNVSRILGKLTLHETPRSQINQDVERHVGNLFKLIDPQSNTTIVLGSPNTRQNHIDTKSQEVLLVRIFFVLGNLCASNDRNRQFLGVTVNVVPALLQSLVYYGKKYIHMMSGDQGESSNRPSESADVLVKLVRLIANLAMNTEVGGVFNSYRDELVVLLQVLECSRPNDQEIMLNIVSCLTNLSYYCTFSSSAPTARSFIESNRLKITSLLSQILWDANEEAVLEAARTFGNLSRFKDVLRVMGENKVLDGFVILLDHSNREIVYTVCGVLMNAALDEYARTVLLDIRQMQSDGGEAVVLDARTLLANILECAGVDDVEMSCIAAKVLYNLLLAKKDSGAQQYLASEDGRTLHRSVLTILQALETTRDDDDDTAATRRDLRGVLTQLKSNMSSRN